LVSTFSSTISHSKILLDLHAAPGAQNPDAHSGTGSGKVRMWEDKNADATTFALHVLLSQVIKYDNVVGIELLNEPNNKDWLPEWYAWTLKDLRGISLDIPLYIADGQKSILYSMYMRLTPPMQLGIASSIAPGQELVRTLLSLTSIYTVALQTQIELSTAINMQPKFVMVSLDSSAISISNVEETSLWASFLQLLEANHPVPMPVNKIVNDESSLRHSYPYMKKVAVVGSSGP
jgi:hypothetical protein